MRGCATRLAALVRGEWIGLSTGLVGGATAALYIAKTALAAGLAWQLAVWAVGHPRPYFAPLAVVLVMQVTVRESYLRAVQRVLGVVAGVLVAYFLGRWLGVGAGSIALVVLAGLTLGRLLSLSPAGAVQVPVSALLVMVVGASSPGYALDRVVDTAIGAAVAVGVNLLLLPPTYLDQVHTALGRLADRLGRLLEEMGSELPRLDSAWLERARALEADVAAARQAIALCREAAWWNPAARPQAARLPRWERLLTALEHLAIQLRGLNRSLADAVRDDPGALDRLAPEAALWTVVGGVLQELARRASAGGTVWADLGARLADADAAYRTRLHHPPEAQALSPAAAVAVGGVMAVSRRIVEELAQVLAAPAPRATEPRRP
ncbi:MAG: FUSC family protein [Actinomycetia bacterium]|nr:FUSC family protein [Actinomycetes bacterium]